MINWIVIIVTSDGLLFSDSVVVFEFHGVFGTRGKSDDLRLTWIIKGGRRLFPSVKTKRLSITENQRCQRKHATLTRPVRLLRQASYAWEK